MMFVKLTESDEAIAKEFTKSLLAFFQNSGREIAEKNNTINDAIFPSVLMSFVLNLMIAQLNEAGYESTKRAINEFCEGLKQGFELIAMNMNKGKGDFH